MTRIVSPLALASCSLSLILAFPAQAAEDAYAWLLKINQAARALNYEGTFVYQSGTQLETMRILHRVKDGTVEERLVSLTGAAREVIRTADEVRCYLPDQKSIVVEHRRANGKSFPAIVPDRLRDLADNYVVELGRPGRVSGRLAQGILIMPRDDFRYGYHLWADRDTGLLLKADLLNNKRNVLEQFMFTDIRIGADISDAALAPQTAGAGMVWYRNNKNGMTSTAKPVWQVTRLPKGFKLSSSLTRKMPTLSGPAEHLVYTDGLATVSVFVEKLEQGRDPVTEGPSRMGALYVLGKAVNRHHVTVVGEVPAKTVALIGNAIAPMDR